MASSSNTIQRKVIDISGRLGSFYDVTCDILLDKHSNKNFESAPRHHDFDYKVFLGDEYNNAIDILKERNFNESILQSILLGLVKPTGISSIINYDQPIDKNTCFLYYSYKSREKKLYITDGEVARIIAPPPLESSTATHMITEILWGFELLCVIQVSKYQSVDTVKQLLDHIFIRCLNDHKPLKLTINEMCQIYQLSNITLFGSEICLDSPDISLSTLINNLEYWQINTSFHRPLEYTMCSLTWLFHKRHFSKPNIMLDGNNSSIPKIEHILIHLWKWIQELKQLFKNLSKNCSTFTKYPPLKFIPERFDVIMNTYEDFRIDLGQMLINVRRGTHKSTEILKIISDKRYSCLRAPANDLFYEEVEQFLAKRELIDILNDAQIQYVNVLDVFRHQSAFSTIEDIDEVLKHYFLKEDGLVIIWYSSDRLKREQKIEWEQKYQQFILERQTSTKRTNLIYADFSQCQHRLDDNIVRRLPESSFNHHKVRPLPPVPSFPPKLPPIPSERSLVPPERTPVPPEQTPVLPEPTPVPPERTPVPPAPSDRPPTPPKRSTVPSERLLPPPTPSERLLVPPAPSDRPSTLPKRPPERSLFSPALPQRPPIPPERLSTLPGRPPILKERSLPVIDINVLLLGETGVGKSTFINAFVNYLMFDTLQQAEQNEPIVIIPVSFLTTVGDQFDEFIVQFGNVDQNENYEHLGQSVTQQCKSYVFNLNERLRLRLIDSPGMGDTRGVDQDVKNIDHILTYVNNLSHLNAICLLLKPNTSRLNIFFRSCVNQLLTYLTPIGYDNIIFCFTNARSTFFAPGDTGPLLRQMLKQENLDGIPFGKTNTFCFDSESFRYLAARKRGVTFDDFQNEECIRSWTTSVTQSVRLLSFIQKRKPYYLNEWQSPKKVALEISMLARPLMEMLRVILYNWKLHEVGLVKKEIILKSDPVTGAICSDCAQSSNVEVNPFWVITYGSEKKKQCLCPFNERHFLIEFIVKHEFVVPSIDLSTDDLQAFFNNFLYKCDRLIYFLRQKKLLDQDDPFTSVHKRFLDEELDISNIPRINLTMNRRVQQVLHSIRELREQNSKRLFKLHEELSLHQVCEIINELKSIKMVNEQLECIKTNRRSKMEANEYRVNMTSIKNRSFGEITNIPQ